MIKKLCEFNRRSDFILRVLQDSLTEKPEQQFIILAHNKNLLKYLYDAIKHRKIASVGYYIGGMKQKDLKLSESKKVIIATYAMAEEALDVVNVEIRIVAVRGDEQVFGQRAGTEAEERVRQCQDFLRLTFAIGFIALAANRKEKRMHASCIDGVDCLQARYRNRNHRTGDFVDQLTE